MDTSGYMNFYKKANYVLTKTQEILKFIEINN